MTDSELPWYQQAEAQKLQRTAAKRRSASAGDTF